MFARSRTNGERYRCRAPSVIAGGERRREAKPIGIESESSRDIHCDDDQHAACVCVFVVRMITRCIESDSRCFGEQPLWSLLTMLPPAVVTPRCAASCCLLPAANCCLLSPARMPPAARSALDCCGHGELQSLWIIHTAAVSLHRCGHDDQHHAGVVGMEPNT